MEAVPSSKKFEVIKELLQKKYSLILLCKLAGVSRSGFYKWMNRQTFVSPKQREDEAMKLKIVECYEKLKGIYGYRRVKIWLKRSYAIHMNHKRVQRLMGELGIQAVIRRKRPYYGKKEAYVISENHLNREFNADLPNQKWVTDITYLIFKGQRLYLSAIKDLFNNEIVAYQISPKNDLKLVLDTVKKARRRRETQDVLLESVKYIV
ncbi:IS3 family transposase [Paenibacillus tianjinensis]|uniref:IS3 family transposase n=1 Tax=Paenibacillus tianjinensis TaxID=2810347 RepID=A0ABX7L4J3_9BACL|nr:IS3 family transposase [Paenibacillus tianjinensis]QSF42845.1 IS3 family transposase [Paenibacillus tianjinensis]